MKTGIVVLGLLSSLSQQSEFERYQAQMGHDYQAYQAEQQNQYDAFTREYRRGFEQYKRGIREKWSYAEVSTSHKLVIYGEQLNVKLAVDYAKGEVRFSTLKQGQTLAQLKAEFMAMFARPLSEITEKQLVHSDTQLSLAASLALSEEEVAQLAEKLIQESAKLSEQAVVQQTLSDISQTTAVLGQLDVNQGYTHTLKNEQLGYQQLLNQNEINTAQTFQHAVSDKRWQRTKPYRTQVNAQAKNYRLPPALIYAVMETESSFNPLAQSPIPAFGLMQIVPGSAGKDVNLYLHQSSQAPTVKQLFDPNTNLIFGTTYFNLLFNRYFASVKSPQSRLYCAIAAYNTGPGNVARTFNGTASRSLVVATQIINTKSPEEVRKHLMEHLPYEETRRYLGKVLKAQNYYASVLDNQRQL